MKLLKEYTTKGDDPRKIVIFRRKRLNENTEYEKNRPNIIYYWVRMWSEISVPYWFSIKTKPNPLKTASQLKTNYK